MARVNLVVEGEVCPNGVVFAPGSLKIYKEKVPVMWGTDRNTLIGVASDFQRDGGTVSMDIDLLDDRLTDLLESAKDVVGVDVAAVVLEGDGKEVLTAEVKAVVFITNSGNPGASIKDN